MLCGGVGAASPLGADGEGVGAQGALRPGRGSMASGEAGRAGSRAGAGLSPASSRWGGAGFGVFEPSVRIRLARQI